jgi:hypothetical protein
MDLQSDAEPGSALHEARALAGRPDLSASVLGRRGCHGRRYGRRHRKDEQADPAKWYPHLAHRPRSQGFRSQMDKPVAAPRRTDRLAFPAYFLRINRVDIVDCPRMVRLNHTRGAWN